MSGTPVFHEPWWLDACAPGLWTEVATEGGARWPFVADRRGQIVRVLRSPALTPRLGPLLPEAEGKLPKQLSREREAMDELLGRLPPHDILIQNLRPGFRPWIPLVWKGARILPRLSYVISKHNEDDVWAGLGEGTRRAIRKAEKLVQVEGAGEATALSSMAVATFERQERDLPYSPEILHRLVAETHARNQGTVLVARDENHFVHAATFLVWDDERLYYLVGGADPTGRESNAMSLLLWTGIKLAIGRGIPFDFEGSMEPSIERFFRGFGAEPETYLQVMHFGTRRGRAVGAALDLLPQTHS